MSTSALDGQTATFEIGKGPNTDKIETVRATIQEHTDYNRVIRFVGGETRHKAEVGVEGTMESPTAVLLDGNVPEWAEPLLRQLGIREVR